MAYQMETFSALLAPCAPVNSPHKGQWRVALMCSLICAWTNGSVNNREAGDLRRHRAHYDVIVMETSNGTYQRNSCRLILCNKIIIRCVLFLAATKQLYKWYFPSVRPSVGPAVRPSVTPFWLCSHHRIIMKFSGVITNDQSKVNAKGQGQRSKVKVTEVTTQLNRFRTATPVWIHIWWWNDAYSLMLLRRGALLFFKVIRHISRSHGSKNRRIWPRLGVSGL